MFNAITHLNYLAVFVVAIAGFLLGWLWYSSVLFGKFWMVEMKITPAAIEAAKPHMARLFAMGFAFTLLSTFALAVLVYAHGSGGALSGAELGLFVGAMVVGTRYLNGSLWEQRSGRLQVINVGHEIALFAMQGAIFGLWR